MKPKFEHDCQNCEFLGHYAEHDVYICKREGESPFNCSIIARYDNDGADYASQPLDLFKQQIEQNNLIGGNDDGKEWRMSFQDFLFSDKVTRYHKAWMLALAVKGTP